MKYFVAALISLLITTSAALSSPETLKQSKKVIKDVDKLQEMLPASFLDEQLSDVGESPDELLYMVRETIALVGILSPERESEGEDLEIEDYMTQHDLFILP